MKVFKYLIFIITTTFSYQAYAGWSYIYDQSNKPYETALLACKAFADIKGYTTEITVQIENSTSARCFQKNSEGNNSFITNVFYSQSDKCPPKDKPIIVYFDDGAEVPLTTCEKQTDGSYCIAKAKSENPLILVGGNYLGVQHRSQVTLYSLSETPSSTCTPEQEKCDPLNPYGKCYKPPNDGCTRQKNGSIECPPDVEKTKNEDTCKGATYCTKPSTGCGSGYVSGSFNGQSLCVKSSTSTADQSQDKSVSSDNTDGTKTVVRENGDGTKSISTTSSDGSTSTTDSASNGVGTTTTVSSDGTKTVVDSKTTTTVNNDGSKTTTVENKDGSKVEIKVSSDGTKLTTTTTKSDGTKTVVDSDKVDTKAPDKTDPDPDKDGSGVDLSGVIAAINAAKSAIVSAVDKVKEAVSDLGDSLSELKDWLMGDADTSSMTDVEVPEKQLDEKSFSENLYSSSAQCPVDRTLSFKLLGRADFTKTFSFQMLCDHLSIFGQLIMLAAYIYAARIVTRDS